MSFSEHQIRVMIREEISKVVDAVCEASDLPVYIKEHLAVGEMHKSLVAVIDHLADQKALDRANAVDTALEEHIRDNH